MSFWRKRQPWCRRNKPPRQGRGTQRPAKRSPRCWRSWILPQTMAIYVSRFLPSVYVWILRFTVSPHTGTPIVQMLARGRLRFVGRCQPREGPQEPVGAAATRDAAQNSSGNRNADDLPAITRDRIASAGRADVAIAGRPQPSLVYPSSPRRRLKQAAADRSQCAHCLCE